MEQAVHEVRLKKGMELPIEVYDINARCNEGQPMRTPHYHEHIEFLYADRECDVDVWIAGESVRFRTGDMLVINSNSAHTFVNHLPKNRYICIKALPKMVYSSDSSFFDMKYASPFFGNSLFSYRLLKASELVGSDVGQYFLCALKEWIERGYGYEVAVKAEVLRIFLWTVRHGYRIGIYPPEGMADAAENVRLIQKSVELINESYADITETDAAAAASMSTSHYSRQFKLVMGRSFREYLAATRINAAERLLLTTDMSVTDIALATGFATSSHFIECFKKAKHTTPARYRLTFLL